MNRPNRTAQDQTEQAGPGGMTAELRDAFEVVFTLATCQLARSCCQARTEGEAALNLAAAWVQQQA